MAKIRDYLVNYDLYKVDYDYQRPADAWSREDKQCLIDTILKSEPMPLFFLNQKDGYLYIIDGQQRLGTIRDYHQGKFGLSGKFSGENLDGVKFEQLPENLREKFLDYDLRIHLIKNYDDEKVRMLFSRLQRGKPLSIGERMNAMPGEIVKVMRKLAKHPFIAHSIAINQDKYGAYPDVMRILKFEFEGASESGSDKVYSFMSDHRSLSENEIKVKEVISNLDYLRKCFPEDKYAHLEKHAWVLTVYSLISDLKKEYVISGKEEQIGKFIKDFHGCIYSEDWRCSNPLYQKFYDNVRGGWSKNIITLRLMLIKDALLGEIELVSKDPKRQITTEEKIALCRKYPNCQMCGYKFKDYKDAEYHHVARHADGGVSQADNIMVLCKNCHHKIHKADFEMPTEDEFTEVDV